MRTTVDLDPELISSARELAARRHTTLSVIVEEALRESAARRYEAKRAERTTLPVDHREGGMRPGADLDDNAALLELMDSADDPV